MKQMIKTTIKLELLFHLSIFLFSHLWGMGNVLLLALNNENLYALQNNSVIQPTN